MAEGGQPKIITDYISTRYLDLIRQLPAPFLAAHLPVRRASPAVCASFLREAVKTRVCCPSMSRAAASTAPRHGPANLTGLP